MEAFPPLPLDRWVETRDTLQGYARLVGSIRERMAPRKKHWSHVTLRLTSTGLTTLPLPAGPCTFEVLFDLADHRLAVTTSCGDRWSLALRGQPVSELCRDLTQALRSFGIEPLVDPAMASDEAPRPYDRTEIERFWQVLSQTHLVFERFQGGFEEHSTPVQLFPHHFDLAVLWISGRKVPGRDPADHDQSDEQMNFGFVTGDETIPGPYYYATAYPHPEGLERAGLPTGARWQTEGFRGAVLCYDEIAGREDAGDRLLGFLRTVYEAGRKLMADRSRNQDPREGARDI